MQAQRVNSRSLAPAELAAWRGFLRVHSSLVRRLDAQLREAHGISLQEYEVLLVLGGAPERRMRMSEIASAVLLSQSGLTRLVDRLVRAGAVARVRCSDDRRGQYAELTEAGLAQLRQARPTHLAGVREGFLAHFDEAELETLATLWERVAPGSTG